MKWRLFHGTDAANIDSINAHNFSRSFAGVNGKGYFVIVGKNELRSLYDRSFPKTNIPLRQTSPLGTTPRNSPFKAFFQLISKAISQSRFENFHPITNI